MKNAIPNFRQFRLFPLVFILINTYVMSAWAQAPVITDFTATAAIGSSIYIEGENLSTTTSVLFGSVSAVLNYTTDDTLEVVVPKFAPTANLTVITSAGSVTTTTAFTPYVIWNGGTGNWNSKNNWSDGEVPVQTTNVVINSGKPTIQNTNAYCNNLINNSGLTIKAGGDLYITGIFQNLATYTQIGGEVHFIAPNGIQQVPALKYTNIRIGGGGEKQLLGNTTVTGTLTFASSNLTTVDPANTTLTLNGNMVGESVNSRYIGKLVKTRPINGTITDQFGGIGISFANTGGGNWGDVVVTRVTGTSVANGADQSIQRYWNISPQYPNTNTTVSLSLTWFDIENNTNLFLENKAQVFRSGDNGVTWAPLAIPQEIGVNGNERTITVQTSMFSKLGVFDKNTPLPVSWLYFNGKATSNGNLLSWATATEKNADSFIVERSLNGRSFEAIGTVKAAGNSNQVLTYSFTDAAPAGEKTYYRLKQTDLDGAFSYSTIIVVSNNAKGRSLEAEVYPNPFAETLNLKLKATDAVSEVKLISLDGKEVYRKVINNTADLTLGNLPSLKPGMYLLQLHGANGITTLKVTRQ